MNMIKLIEFSWIIKKVKNVNNKDIVYIEELILDRDSNSIEHAQISDDVNYYMKLNVNKYFFIFIR